MSSSFTILGIAGSLRPGSYSRASLVAAGKLVPRGAKLKIFDLQGIPANGHGATAVVGARVLELKQEIRAADALLFAVPEYLYGLLAVLENAIDSAAQPPRDNAWAGKSVALISVSEAAYGPVRAQHLLKHKLVELNMIPLMQQEVLVLAANKAFDWRGRFVDTTE